MTKSTTATEHTSWYCVHHKRCYSLYKWTVLFGRKVHKINLVTVNCICMRHFTIFGFNHFNWRGVIQSVSTLRSIYIVTLSMHKLLKKISKPLRPILSSALFSHWVNLLVVVAGAIDMSKLVKKENSSCNFSSLANAQTHA